MKAPALLVLVYLVFSTAIVMAGTESQRMWSFNQEGLTIKIYSPFQAYPGDSIALQVTVDADKELQDVDATIVIRGALSEGYEMWTIPRNILEDEDFSATDSLFRNLTVSIPASASSGLVYGRVYLAWNVNGTHRVNTYEDSCEIFYLMNEELEELRTAYDELNATHHALLSNYTDIDARYVGELGGARNMMYVFVATTVIALGTVLFLILRRPKTFYA